MCSSISLVYLVCFFFNDPATTEIYPYLHTRSLPDALPIFNGIVTERAMSAGEYRGPSTSHILTIAQINPLNVEVFAPIAQLGMVDVGDMVAIFPEDPVGGQYMARVKVIDRVFDAASGTFGMRDRKSTRLNSSH